MKSDEAEPVAVLAAKKRVYNLTCPRRVAIGLMRVVRMHSIPAAWLLVDVGLNDIAVVKGDGCLCDDVVLHWVWV